MAIEQAPLELPGESNEERVWTKILRTILALPYTKVDRKPFLRAQLRPYCTEQQIEEAIDSRPAQAGIQPAVIDLLADSCIRSHVLRASGTSFAAGLPGGFAMAATIPADLVQLHWNALLLAQKLAYLYGWPDLLENGEVDEQTELELTLLFGTMTGVAAADRGLAELAKRFSEQVIRRLPRQALTKTAYYPIAKKVASILSDRKEGGTVDRGESYKARIRWRTCKGCAYLGRSYFRWRDSSNPAPDG